MLSNLKKLFYNPQKSPSRDSNLYITDYFHQIQQIISNCPAIISKSILFDQRTKYIGFIKGTLIFRDNSKLYFKEFVDTD